MFADLCWKFRGHELVITKVQAVVCDTSHAELRAGFCSVDFNFALVDKTEPWSTSSSVSSFSCVYLSEADLSLMDKSWSASSGKHIWTYSLVSSVNSFLSNHALGSLGHQFH